MASAPHVIRDVRDVRVSGRPSSGAAHGGGGGGAATRSHGCASNEIAVIPNVGDIRLCARRAERAYAGGCRVVRGVVDGEDWAHAIVLRKTAVREGSVLSCRPNQQEGTDSCARMNDHRLCNHAAERAICAHTAPASRTTSSPRTAPLTSTKPLRAYDLNPAIGTATPPLMTADRVDRKL